jgi:bifunctional DNA primase/polymerase-like protein
MAPIWSASRALRTRHPQANVGLATGHRFDVLDVDGPAGAHAIQELAATHGLQSSGPLVRTGGGWLAIRAHEP